MNSGIVLSIHSVHARNIYSGLKRYEYRTRKPSQNVEYIALYETGTTKAVTGIAKITGILEGAPTTIWELTKSFAGIRRDFFRRYFAGKKKAYAYCISEVTSFQHPVELRDLGIEHAPQSFQYIDEQEMKKLLEIKIEDKKPLQPRFFVGGIHGVGKTTFVKKVASEMGLPFFTASDVIATKETFGSNKVISENDIESNQSSLVSTLHNLGWFDAGGILDGHFLLKTAEHGCSPIPVEVFEELKLDSIFVLSKSPSIILDRLQSRGDESWSLAFIKEMQEGEIAYARQIAERLDIPLSIIR